MKGLFSDKKWKAAAIAFVAATVAYFAGFDVTPVLDSIAGLFSSPAPTP